MYYFGFYHCCKKNIRRDFQNVVRGYLTFSLVRWDSSAGLQVYCCQPDSSVGLFSVYRLCPSTQHCFVDLEDHITSLDAVPLASSMCIFLSVTTTKTNLSYTKLFKKKIQLSKTKILSEIMLPFHLLKFKWKTLDGESILSMSNICLIISSVTESLCPWHSCETKTMIGNLPIYHVIGLWIVL